MDIGHNQPTKRYPAGGIKARGFLLILALAFIVSHVPEASAQVTPTNQPAPAWMAWRTFHNSLAFYNQQSADRVTKMLNLQFGLTAAQANALLKAGQTYLGNTQQIEAQTTAEIRRRYLPSFSGQPLPTGANIPIARQDNLQRAKADGLYDQMEGLHQSALDSHLNSLKGQLTDAQITQIRTFVQTFILPKITVLTVGPKTPRNPGLPPGVTKAPPLVR